MSSDSEDSSSSSSSSDDKLHKSKKALAESSKHKGKDSSDSSDSSDVEEEYDGGEKQKADFKKRVDAMLEEMGPGYTRAGLTSEEAAVRGSLRWHATKLF